MVGDEIVVHSVVETCIIGSEMYQTRFRADFKMTLTLNINDLGHTLRSFSMSFDIVKTAAIVVGVWDHFQHVLSLIFMKYLIMYHISRYFPHSFDRKAMSQPDSFQHSLRYLQGQPRCKFIACSEVFWMPFYGPIYHKTGVLRYISFEWTSTIEFTCYPPNKWPVLKPLVCCMKVWTWWGYRLRLYRWIDYVNMHSPHKYVFLYQYCHFQPLIHINQWCPDHNENIQHN